MSIKKQKAKRAILLGLDGADPMVVKRLLSEGRLPNMKKVIESGTTTEDLSMMGAHPTITPPNWASMATGAYPGTHGITCFWSHTTGDPLNQLKYGFNSKLNEAETIWDAASKVGKKCIIFNYPTGWPPTNKENLVVVDGTGIVANTRSLADNERIYHCEKGDFPIREIPHEIDQSGVNCMVEGEVDEKTFGVDIEGSEATTGPSGEKITMLADKRIEPIDQTKVDLAYTPIKPCEGWKKSLDSNTKEAVLPINYGQQRRYALIISEDGSTYSKIEIYKSKNDEKPIGEATKGNWSAWIYDDFKIDGKNVPVAYKIKVMDLSKDGNKLDLYYSYALNLSDDKWYYPKEICGEIYREVGPMLHQSNCGDHEIMAEVQAQLYDWYAQALLYLTKNDDWSLVYAHVHALDVANHMYQNKILEEHSSDYKKYIELLERYYEISDKFVGDLLKRVDDETLLLVVSDHGGMSKEAGCETPLIGDPWSMAGRLLEELGYMSVKEENGTMEIDWENTKAVSQRSGYIYVNLKGREPHGSVVPEEYDSLVEKIIDDLYSYRDPKSGRRPINFALRKEDMKVLGLYGEHVGDIYFTFNPSWTRVHGTQLTTSSYKGTSVGCLFMMTGPGVKKGEIIKRPVRVVDIAPTISWLTGIPAPKDAEGGIIYQALEERL